MKSYKVYKHTSPSGKVYIGITAQAPSKRWQGGYAYRNNKHFYSAIKKYGWENFKHEILADGLTGEQAEEMEINLIAEHNATDPVKGYNIALGGQRGGGMSPEARKRLSDKMTGDNNPTRRLGHPFAGRHHSEESRAIMSAKAKARTDRTVTAETRAKLRAVQAKKAVINLDTGATYEGIHTAAEITGTPATKICAVCQGKRKTAGGYRWEYK